MWGSIAIITIITIIVIIIFIMFVTALVVGEGTVQSVERLGYEMENQRIAIHSTDPSCPRRSPSLLSSGY
jgi:hypothetical protein